MDGAIVGMSGEYVCDVDGGYRLIFGENITVVIASGGAGSEMGTQVLE